MDTETGGYGDRGIQRQVNTETGGTELGGYRKGGYIDILIQRQADTETSTYRYRRIQRRADTGQVETETD